MATRDFLLSNGSLSSITILYGFPYIYRVNSNIPSSSYFFYVKIFIALYESSAIAAAEPITHESPREP